MESGWEKFLDSYQADPKAQESNPRGLAAHRHCAAKLEKRPPQRALSDKGQASYAIDPENSVLLVTSIPTTAISRLPVTLT